MYEVIIIIYMTDIDRQFYPKMVIVGLFMYGARFYNKSNGLFINKFISLW